MVDLNRSQQTVLSTGLGRYERFVTMHRARFGEPPRRRILDFGCGAGGFMLSALQAGREAWGVEVDSERQSQFMAISEAKFPQWRDRFTLYDGRLMPLPSNHFGSCYTWFVFEHVTDPQISLREIVRVLAPGGTLSLFADDVRNQWDGHVVAPWPAYLPREFAAPYLEGMGKAEHGDFITKYVVYISAPMICDILTTLGMEIVYANGVPDRPAIPEGLYVTNAAEARALGRQMRDLDVPGIEENLTIFARKPMT